MEPSSSMDRANGIASSDESSTYCLRWRPLAVILLIAAAVQLGIIFFSGLNPGYRNLAIGAAGGLTFLAILVWAGSFSGLARRTRRLSVGIPVALIATFFTFFRIQGVSGDMIPEL